MLVKIATKRIVPRTDGTTAIPALVDPNHQRSTTQAMNLQDQGYYFPGSHVGHLMKSKPCNQANNGTYDNTC
ncbi:TPA: hypothetical protein ACHVI3_000767 [Streptococcus suis]